MKTPILALAPLALLAAPAPAQSFNIDVGDAFTFGQPADTYGAGAAQPGRWNAVAGGLPYLFNLVDLAGAPTPVMTSVVRFGNGGGDFAFDNPATMGDDQALMDDCEDVGSGTSLAIWTFDGIANGDYLVYTYAMAPDDATFLTIVRPGGTTQDQVIGGAWPGGHQQGVTHALHCVTVTNNLLVMEVQATSGFASCNGFQIVQTANPCGGGPGSPFCSCDAGSAFPTGVCGNTGDVDRGCANGSFPSGAGLDATGATNPDSVVLRATSAVPGQPGLFFQGDNAIAGGGGIVFGDGLRCAGGNVIRLQVVTADAAGTASSSVSISATGGVGPGAGARYYQYWYRDPAGSPCGSGFNTSNGYEIVW